MSDKPDRKKRGAEPGSKLMSFERLSTAHQAADEIQSAILSGRLDLGAPLSEQALCDQMKISRTPVRAALQILKQRGLVEVEPYRGTRVFRPSIEDIEQLCDFRATLEEAALRAAVEHDRAGLIKSLQAKVELAEECLSKGNLDQYGRIDSEFHDAIFEASPNAYLQKAHGAIALRLAVMRNLMNLDQRHVELSNRGHTRVVEAIKQGSIDDAVEILRDHIRRGSASFCRHFLKVLLGDGTV